MKACNHSNDISNPSCRSGYTLVLVALTFTAMIGMLGLIIDGGFVFFMHRAAQNGADFGARSAALKLHELRTQSKPVTQEVLEAAATAIIQTNYDQINLPPKDFGQVSIVVNHPPASGWFIDNENYVEVIVEYPIETFFMHAAGGTQANRTTARAVAGFEVKELSAGLVILDPRANPGLEVQGTGTSLFVGHASDDGTITKHNALIYTRKVGENEFGETVGQYSSGQPSVTLGGQGAFIANSLYVSGGVDDADNYTPPSVNELHAGTNDPVFDPFHLNNGPNQPAGTDIPIPIQSNGVVVYSTADYPELVTPTVPKDGYLGSVMITNANQQGPSFDDPSTPLVTEGPNQKQYVDPNTGETVTLLNPGIYDRITITGGNVRFNPGVYVLQPSGGGGGNIFTINGGAVIGRGILLYNTGNDYESVLGMPDELDRATPSEIKPATTSKFQGIDIHGSNVTLTGIDIADPNIDYSPFPGIEVFDQMLFYQRRANPTVIQISDGEAYDPVSRTGLSGYLYSKWGNVLLSGSGTYNFALVIGSLAVRGNAAVTTVQDIPLAPIIQPVRLVEGSKPH